MGRLKLDVLKRDPAEVTVGDATTNVQAGEALVHGGWEP